MPLHIYGLNALRSKTEKQLRKGAITQHNYVFLSCSFHILQDIVVNAYYVSCRLKKHVSDPTNPPILIFPEGTCINNTSVMQFKKGSFEVGSVIYPVAIKVIFCQYL